MRTSLCVSLATVSAVFFTSTVALAAPVTPYQVGTLAVKGRIPGIPGGEELCKWYGHEEISVEEIAEAAVEAGYLEGESTGTTVLNNIALGINNACDELGGSAG